MSEMATSSNDLPVEPASGRSKSRTPPITRELVCPETKVEILKHNTSNNFFIV